ncbi:hypothetical protein TH53_23050 [Pedobacter lusitanus]|uniref:Uncharacterized protein n=1 Tax=Pedobacter lusitanus TaxID=1503925 RepID=A0A0D0GFU3_9SPHI|nr:hypothetical protein [Pedobacter lusitanus]KIO75000.1 hypothetical protein TH53_23050 [Pedobacter lusitanus]
MDRREIFNIFFKGGSVNEPVVLAPDPVLETPAHLKTDQTIPVCQEWTAIPATGRFNPEISTAYAFTVTLDLDYSLKSVHHDQTINPVQLILGIKNEQPASIQETAVKAGLNQEGYLFINNLTDLRMISKDKLLTGVQLVLTVSPLGMGMTFAKLKIMDRAGLTLSSIKSMQYTTADWAGELTVTNPDFNLLRIEGLRGEVETIRTEDYTQLK